MILGEIEMTGYQDDGGRWVSSHDVTTKADDKPFANRNGGGAPGARAARTGQEAGRKVRAGGRPAIRLESRAQKMSKSRGNVVNPDRWSPNTAPIAAAVRNVHGPARSGQALEHGGGQRCARLSGSRMADDHGNERSETLELNAAVVEDAADAEQNRVLHRTIQDVTQDIERMSFNTAIAQMMEFTNFFMKEDVGRAAAMEKLVLLLSPFAPHLAEELWQLLGHEKTLAYEPWPDVRRGGDQGRHDRSAGAGERQAARPRARGRPRPIRRRPRPPPEPTRRSKSY